MYMCHCAYKGLAIAAPAGHPRSAMPGGVKPSFPKATLLPAVLKPLQAQEPAGPSGVQKPRIISTPGATEVIGARITRFPQTFPTVGVNICRQPRGIWALLRLRFRNPSAVRGELKIKGGREWGGGGRGQ